MENIDKQEEVEQQFHQLFQDGAFAQALDLATREAHIFPEYSQKVIYAWRMTCACLLGDKAQALRLLSQAVQAGYWYHGLREDADFALLRGDPEFERLVALCVERRAQAMASTVPVIKTYSPTRTQPPYPLLLALHGANATAEADHWMAALSHGWFLGMPQSSQLYSPGAYTWNDWDWALQEVPQRYQTICAENPVDTNRVVLAGFSQGGGLAAWLGLSRLIPARGLILVGPFLVNVDRLLPVLDANGPYDLRAYIVAGARDQYCYGIAQQLASLLPNYGIVCKLNEYDDLEHSFPQDFERKLPEALDFVAG